MYVVLEIFRRTTGSDQNFVLRWSRWCGRKQDKPHSLTVTRVEIRAATEAVKAVASLVLHGKKMFNLDGQVPSNPFLRTRSLDKGQGYSCLQCEAVSLEAAKHLKLAETLTAAAPVNSALLSIETSHFERNFRSILKIDSQTTRSKCQGATLYGKVGSASSSSVLSLDGAPHFARGDSSTLETDPQVTSPSSQAGAACGRTAQELDSSVLLLNGASNFRRGDRTQD